MVRLELGILENFSPCYVGMVETAVKEALRMKFDNIHYILWPANSPHCYIYQYSDQKETVAYPSIRTTLRKYLSGNYSTTLVCGLLKWSTENSYEFTMTRLPFCSPKEIHFPSPDILNKMEQDDIYFLTVLIDAIENTWEDNLHLLQAASF